MEKMQKLFLIVMNHEYPLQSFSVKIFNILKKIKISNLYLWKFSLEKHQFQLYL